MYDRERSDDMFEYAVDMAVADGFTVVFTFPTLDKAFAYLRMMRSICPTTKLSEVTMVPKRKDAE